MTLNFRSKLSKDLFKLLNDACDHDVIIRVGENQSKKVFRAHSLILRARSHYFKNALSTKWIMKEDNMIIFNKPNVTPSVFEMILGYIYTGELILTKKFGEDIFELLVASDELLLEELFGEVQNYLIKNRNSWVRENAAYILNTAVNLNYCEKLRDYCVESICEDPLPFLTSEAFLSINKEILFSLLERDNLSIEEIKIWNYLIKWSIEQTPGLGDENNDRIKWNNENYEALKETLKEFIPLIRFLEISRADFFDKVQPYKIIFPNNIYEEIEKFHNKNILLETTTFPPENGLIIESNIVKPKLANMIINWIDKKRSMYNRTRNDPLYKFNLVYRSSRDGTSNKSFREKCKGRVASLVLIKIRKSEKIFGGYSSIGFSPPGCNSKYLKFYNSSDNFIFSFESGGKTKISRVINNDKAILDDGRHGFDFGKGSLSMNGNILHVGSKSKNYENNLRDTYNSVDYTIEEIETFNIRCN